MLIVARDDVDFGAQFEGFAFVGHDYINGFDGLADYTAATGRAVPPGEDGCYVVARRVGDGLEIGTDSAGLSQLFLYRSGDDWVVCSSFSGLVQSLRMSGKPLTLNARRLKPFTFKHSFTLQLSTFQTAFDEIRLLPVGSMVSVHRGSLEVRRLSRASAVPYAEALAEFLSIWRGRLRTLLADERIIFTADLTGGVDSRTVFAFLLESGMFDTSLARFSLLSNRSQREDLSSATSIADHFGLAVNGPRPERVSTTPGSVSYRHWREHCLGVYLPVYADQALLSPFEVHGHGGGGGTIRGIYESASPVDMVRGFKGKMAGRDWGQWLSDMRKTELALEETDSTTPANIRHYAEFRNRFHFGHMPKARPLYTPLNSKYTRRVMAAMPDSRRRMFYFDVMESLSPGLKDFPYDRDDKRLSSSGAESLTVIRPCGEPAPGHVYASTASHVPHPQGGSIRGFDLWLEDVQVAVKNDYVKSFFGGRAMSLADSAVRGVVEKRGPYQSHSAEAVLLSSLLAVDFVAG